MTAFFPRSSTGGRQSGFDLKSQRNYAPQRPDNRRGQPYDGSHCPARMGGAFNQVKGWTVAMQPTNHLPIPLLDIGRSNRLLRDEILQALAEVYDSGRFLYGPQVTELEQSVARLSNTRHAVGCASGSDAILLALMALDIQPGDEVIVPSFTFFATASAVARLGAKVVFADIDPQTYNMDVAQVAAKISDRTRAIIPVHLFGQPADMTSLCAVAGERDIPVIEDAAQAIGAAYHGRPVGSWGLMGCISFYPTKNLGGFGDGGMLVANSDTLTDRLRLLAGHGMRPRYYHREIGINSRLDTFQAAALAVKIKHLDGYTAARQAVAARYQQLLMESGLVESGVVSLPYQDPAAFHVWNQYSLRVAEGRRDELRQHLTEQRVGSGSAIRSRCTSRSVFNTWAISPPIFRRPIGPHARLHLPIFPELTVDEQAIVVGRIADFYHRAQAARLPDGCQATPQVC